MAAMPASGTMHPQTSRNHFFIWLSNVERKISTTVSIGFFPYWIYSVAAITTSVGPRVLPAQGFRFENCGDLLNEL